MKRSQEIKTTCIVGLFLTASGSMGHAQEQGFEYSISLGAEREAAYTGSDVYVVGPSADFEIRYNAATGHSYYVSLGEIGADWRLSPTSRLRTNLEFEPGRENADDQILAGLPVMENTVELQAVYLKELGDWRIGAGLQYDVLKKGKGLVGFIGAGYERKISDRLKWEANLDVSFANAEHMQTEVGISAASAAATGLAAYTAGGGYKGATAEIRVTYDVSDRFEIYKSLSVETYGSNMADSPLIATHGTRTNLGLALGTKFKF